MTQMTTTATRAPHTRLTGPGALVLAWVCCTLASTGWVLLTAHYGATNDGTAALVASAGTVAAAGCATAGALLRRRSAWRPAGAVVLAGLAVVTIPFLGWFTALPAYLGVAAAWVGGPLDPDATVPGTAPRIAGVIGACIAMLAALIFTGGFLLALGAALF